MTQTVPSPPAKPEPPIGIGTRIGVLVVYGLFAMTGLMGLLTLWAGLRLLVTGEQHWGVALVVAAAGCAFTAIGVGFFYYQFVQAPAQRARRRMLEARHPGQPWMLRRDWAARRVTDSTLGPMVFMWIWVSGWWGAILFIWTMNRDKILAAAAASWWEAALGLVFVGAGLIGLLLAVHMTRAWWRFGRSTLRIDTLPGRLGQTFRGTLEANFRDRPAALEAEIVCEYQRWVTHYSGGKRQRERRTERVWSAVHPLDTSRMMLGDAQTAATLPISVPLPADQPPCGLDDNDEGIVWRLNVREVGDASSRDATAARDDAVTVGEMGKRGPAYSATFEVPVLG